MAHEDRLEELRAAIRAESISWGEIAELQSLAPFVAEGDVELAEWAGIPEQKEAGVAALELHVWFTGKPEENDFELLTQIGDTVRRQWRNVEFEVVEVPDEPEQCSNDDPTNSSSGDPLVAGVVKRLYGD